MRAAYPPGRDLPWWHRQERPRTAAPRGRRKPIRPARRALGSEQSAGLRKRLLASRGQLESADEAGTGSMPTLRSKNTLIAADADRVELGFREQARRDRCGFLSRGTPQSAPAEGIASPVERHFLAPTDDRATAAIILPVGLGAGADALRRRLFACATRNTGSS